MKQNKDCDNYLDGFCMRYADMTMPCRNCKGDSKKYKIRKKCMLCKKYFYVKNNNREYCEKCRPPKE